MEQKYNKIIIVNETLHDYVKDKKIAVVVNLYYIDDVDNYMEYLCQLQDEIDCLIYTSKEELARYIEKKYADKRRFIVKHKLNRGRDISALLTEFAPISKEYDYFCFIHDKKAREEYLCEDVRQWNRNNWENMLSSWEYINGILELLSHDDLGLLVPPEPIGEYNSGWYSNRWLKNYDNTVKLAEDLGIDVELDENETPISLGTVFWCRRDALKPLLDKQWHYDDFPDEPLPADGTISHAIERILSFVAKSQGYATRVVMTKEYAQELLQKSQDLFCDCFMYCKNHLMVDNVYQLLAVDDEIDEIRKAYSQYKTVYIYGAGDNGIRLLRRLKILGLTTDGFVVSDGERKESELMGIPIFEIKEISDYDNSFFLVAVRETLLDVILSTLKKYGVIHYYPICTR